MFSFLRGKPGGGGKTALERDYQAGGIIFTAGAPLVGSQAIKWLAEAERFAEWELVYYLQQLAEEGYAPVLEQEVILPWDSLYQLLDDRGHRDSVSLLKLPPVATGIVPRLAARGGLSDADFSVSLGWHMPHRGDGARRTGGLVDIGDERLLLPRPAWELAEAVVAFARREDRSRAVNDRGYGRLRKLAIDAGARLDDFISRTVVLTLDKLDMRLRSVESGGTQVVEVLLLAEGAPEDRWLSVFDRHSKVQEHYELACDDGSLVRVVPDEAVQAVLREIKGMPGRRVAGKRAQAFLRNPYAVLGEAMAAVLPPERFEALRREAGICFHAFSLEAERSDSGWIRHVVLTILPEDEHAVAPPSLALPDKDTLARFARAFERAFQAGEPCLQWSGRDLELRGEADAQRAQLSALLAERWEGPQPLIRLDEVFDLSRYSERIVGIDVYKPIYSPYIPKDRDGAAWMPDSIEPLLSVLLPDAAEPLVLRLDDAALRRMDEAVREAEGAGRDAITVPDLPTPMAVANARDILDAFLPRTEQPSGFAEEQAAFEGPPPANPPAHGKGSPLVLVEATNIEEEEYGEERGRLPRFEENTPPVLPGSLRPEIALKPHQLTGVAWLQHLWRCMPDARGCVFADDMGLGKTLQLLTFMHWYLEQADARAPALVVAPVSLLENWRNEIAKFFTPGAARVLTLYGSNLSAVKLRRDALDGELVARGMTRFLRPDWLGDAQIVLTTYETLRDHEFSFSAVRWAIMVCDEAQKIKTPNALVTRAAKKQNVAFKIACTGTPVENSLTDLWCLFDFVQPGLLGALNTFARTYSRPIEARTEEQANALERLRALVEPQVLRRTKQQVADLPPKTEDEGCKALAMSPKQLALYTGVVDRYRTLKECDAEADRAGGAGAQLLGMLHDLRMICADPREAGFRASVDVELREYRRTSPKLDWLMRQLEDIRRRDEKVIVFTEFRDIQRLLQHLIGRHFGLRVSVVNGDTKAQADGGAASRQGIIDAFQRKAGFNVILLSTTAVGFGVNIQAANHVIHFTRPWNPAKEDQATDRAYRIGQEKAVTVYCPTITAPHFVTFEQKLDSLLSSKRQLAGDMLNGCEDIRASDWEGLSAPDGNTVIAPSRVTAEHLAGIEPVVFERLCALLWARQGYQSYCTQRTGDGGIDVVGIRGGEGVLIQCKTSSAQERSLGWNAVRDVVAGAAAYEARHPAVRFQLVAAANCHFNEEAHRQASLNGVRLVPCADIAAMLGRHAVELGELANWR